MALFPAAGPKSSVLHLGPGIVSSADFVDGHPGSVLLAGKANYKRNELLAEAIAWARPKWAKSFMCVGVSNRAFDVLADAFGASACERFDHIDEASMRRIYRRADVYITASIEEGFGLPMVEALTAGCQVIAIRQSLTVEILGDSAILLDDGDFVALGRQLQNPEWIDRSTRLVRCHMYSWDHVAEAVVKAFSSSSA